ncbi:hypothetical protein V9T40_002377 [Parthenolecanium corni]|uniref:Uncharacterized protein n=1 Tax=Parthenolecanium corni TaxID=536013 RepID=A0AAN9Y466_9HEMI
MICSEGLFQAVAPVNAPCTRSVGNNLLPNAIIPQFGIYCHVVISHGFDLQHTSERPHLCGNDTKWNRLLVAEKKKQIGQSKQTVRTHSLPKRWKGFTL